MTETSEIIDQSGSAGGPPRGAAPRAADGTTAVTSRRSRARAPVPPLAWAPLGVLCLAALVVLDGSPDWVRMWGMAIALGLGLKAADLASAWRGGCRPSAARLLAWTLAWPGIDAGRFLGAGREAEPASPRETLRAFACVGLGAALIRWLAPLGARTEPLLGGWLGMWGIVLLLHFGTLRLVSILWRSAGIDARPVMREPARSASLAEFWGSRWNTAFSDAARRFVFAPVARRAGAQAAALAVFLASGIAHELVISVPSRGRYGLPTAYFLLQGVLVLFERTRLARRLGLGQGWRGRAFTGVVALVPAFWLFPPRFVERVALPMLAALGAS